MEVEKFKWRYCYKDISDSEVEIKVIPNKVRKQPKSLYKLYSLSANSVNSITHTNLYAAHPFQFNDVFDCNINLIDFDDFRINEFFLKHIFTEEQIRMQRIKGSGGLDQIVKINLHEIIYRKWGILSMTNNPYNILMWSYYNNHEGFCVEFDYSKFPFKYHGPFPINYQKEIVPISVKESGLHLSIIYQTNIKSIKWKHEKEWRIIIDADGEDMISQRYKEISALGGRVRLFSYPIEAIKNILLGIRFFEYNEIKSSDLKTYKFNLSSNSKKVKLKRNLLDFICKNKIKCTIVRENNDFVNMRFIKGIFEKKDKFNYIFTIDAYPVRRRL